MLTREFSAYAKVLRKYVGFYDTYSHAFEDICPALDALSNSRLTHQIIHPHMLDCHVKAMCYDL